MNERGHADTPHYLRLVAKREAVATGAHFAWVDVTQEAIAAAGSHMPEINKDCKGQRIFPRKRRKNK